MADSEDKDSKTEEASEQKIADARQKGNEPVSQDVSLSVSLITLAAITSLFMGPTIGRMAVSLSNLWEQKLRLDGGWDAINLLSMPAGESTIFIAPIAAAMVLAGISSSLIQNPPALRWTRLTPSLERISPASGFSRIYGQKGLFNFAKTLSKLVLIAVVSMLVLRRSIETFKQAQLSDAALLPTIIQSVMIDLLWSLALTGIAIALADLLWTRWEWMQSLKMTRQEVKDEQKQSSGDPHIKARVAAVGRERSKRRMMAAVPKATLVVVNPTHFAVAMRYVKSEGGAPIVLAKGVDQVALRIREIAENHKIPVIDDVALARSLYKKTKIDQPIPSEFYSAIARLLTIIYSNKSIRH